MKNVIAIIFFSSILLGCGATEESKEILFVCTHGAARSPIAAAYFNKMVEAQGLNYHAVFRGTEPDENLTSGTILGLTKDKFEVKEWQPKKVSADDIAEAYKIVTFDCVLPSENLKSNEEQWDGTPPISKDYDMARNVIKQKVEQFIDKLPKE